MLNRRTQINHQVGQLHYREHVLKELHIGLEIALRDVAHSSVVGHEDIHSLKDWAILKHNIFCFRNGQQVTESLFEEIDLKVERPALDVVIIIFEIGVMGYRFIAWCPPVMLRQQLCECGLARANISCYDDVHKASRYFLTAKLINSVKLS